MAELLVSIIIPCYNAESQIGEAIESALAQTYPKVEVIVIDDGSTDASLDDVKSFGDRIRWETGPNRGACAARNRGLALARGELIQFLDADDVLFPEKLERMVPVVLRGEADIVYADWEVVTAHANVRERRWLPDDGFDSIIRLLGGPLHTLAPLHWKENIQRVGGFRNNLPCCQERDLHLRMACCGMTLQRYPETLVTTRSRVGSVSSDIFQVLKQQTDIFWMVRQTLMETDRLTETRALALARAMARTARGLVNMRQTELAKEKLYLAAQIHPHGIRDTYRGPSRLLHDLFGPVFAQKIIGWKQAGIRRKRSVNS